MAGDEHNPDIPPRLAEALRAAYLVEAPERTLDAEALRRARRPRPWLVRHGPMAAAIVLACGLAVMFVNQTPPDPMDITRDGRVDVLDALALSGRVDGAADGRDLTGDGRVDGRDVEVVMQTIVRLEEVEG